MPTRPALRYQVLASSLNLRAAGALDAKILGAIPKGTRVTRLDTSTDGKWLKLRHERRIGWAAAKYLQAVPASPKKAKFGWYDIARGELGVQEDTGPGSNPRVIEYLRSTTLEGGAASTDETPWCSAFANWCVERAGHAGTDSAWARSWLNWGKATKRPRTGCLVVLKRQVNKGHVGFFVNSTATQVRVLGGNQSNRVCEQEFPLADLLGYRIPA